MSYYNLEQTLEILQKNQPNTLIPFGLPQLADLCRRGKLTPVFSYDRYIIKGAISHHDNVIYIREFTRPFNGYLTDLDLNPLLSKQISTVIITNAYIYEEIGIEHLTSYKDERICLQRHGFDALNTADNIHYYVQGDEHSIGLDDLLFPDGEIQSYISANQPSEKKSVKISKAPPPPSHIQLTSGFKKRTVGDLIKAKQHEGGISPNDCQRITMLYDYFTPHQAGCLMAGLHPEFDGRNDELEIAKGVIEGGIKKGRLILDDDKQIDSDDLKLFLYSKDWVMTGFNDNLTNDKNILNQENPVYQKRVAELEKQVAGAEAEIVKLKSELKERPTAIDDDLKDVPHQAKRTVVRVMYAMAKLTELDNSNPYSQNARTLNEKITTILQNDGLKLEYQAVGKWLKEINEVQSAKK